MNTRIPDRSLQHLGLVNGLGIEIRTLRERDQLLYLGHFVRSELGAYLLLVHIEDLPQFGHVGDQLGDTVRVR